MLKRKFVQRQARSTPEYQIIHEPLQPPHIHTVSYNPTLPFNQSSLTASILGWYCRELVFGEQISAKVALSQSLASDGGATSFASVNAAWLAKQEFTTEYLISGIVEKKDFILISADSKAGKSMFAMQMCGAMATGGEFLGYGSPTQNKILYLDGEMGQQEMNRRINVVSGFNHQNIEVVTEEPRLSIATSKCRAEVKRFIKANSFDMVVFDSFRTLAAGVDENQNDEVRLIMDWLRSLTFDFGVTVVLIHHNNKSGEDYAGSSSFETYATKILRLNRGDGGQLITRAGSTRKECPEFTRLFNDTEWRFDDSIGGFVDVDSVAQVVPLLPQVSYEQITAKRAWKDLGECREVYTKPKYYRREMCKMLRLPDLNYPELYDKFFHYIPECESGDDIKARFDAVKEQSKEINWARAANDGAPF